MKPLRGVFHFGDIEGAQKGRGLLKRVGFFTKSGDNDMNDGLLFFYLIICVINI